MVAAVSKKVKQFLGQCSTTLAQATLNLVEPNSAGITDTIGRAELAAIASAIFHDHIHIATDSITSLHQIRKLLNHTHHSFSLWFLLGKPSPLSPHLYQEAVPLPSCSTDPYHLPHSHYEREKFW